MAKYASSKAAITATDVGMEAMAAAGFDVDLPMQRYYRDARISTVAAGSSQMQRNLIAGLMGLKVQ